MSGAHPIRDGAELIERHLDGGLDPAEAAAFAAWLRADRGHVHALVRAARLHHDLRVAVRARASRAPVTARRGRGSRPRPRHLLALGWLAAAAAVAVFALVGLRSGRTDARGVELAEVMAIHEGATATSTDGTRVALTTGSRIVSGDRVSSGTSPVTLRAMRDDTRLELDPQSTMAFASEGGSLRLDLQAGSVRAVVDKQAVGTELTVRTPQAVAEVVGTRFMITVDARTTRLDVEEGSVRFTRLPGRTVSVVSAGEHATSDQLPLTVSPYQRWTNGPSTDSGFFPIGVWMQEPSLAGRYRDAGFNLYIGLWQGPTNAQLTELRRAGMPVICEQNEFARRHLDDRTIVGWIDSDEPDNAQELPGGSGYGPPVTSEDIVARYRADVARDPTRPVLLNLGQGVAWDGWYGRGERTGHPEDYARYALGCDIAGFDIYPVNHQSPAVTGKLEFVAHGVERLRSWSGGRPVWSFVECTRISGAAQPTPAQVRAEAWMALIHGANGLMYFVHQFAPTENDQALLDDPAMLAAVTALNARISALAPALTSPTLAGASSVSDDASAPVATMLKRRPGTRYLFAVAMSDHAATATFTVEGLPAATTAEVLDEARTVRVVDGRFTDAFAPYGVHLYAIASPEDR